MSLPGVRLARSHDARARACPGPQHVPGSARLTYLRLLDFRDGYYARSGSLDHLNSDGFDCRSGRPRGFFAGARLGLALATARFVAAFPRAALDSFLALGRAVAPFLFWTFDDCFSRLAMIDPLAWRSANALRPDQKTTRPESRQPILRVINRRSQLGHNRASRYGAIWHPDRTPRKAS